MVFCKKNYILLAVSVGIIILGLLLMSGGGGADSTEFTAEIFSTRRIVVAPIVTLIGFLMIIYAIIDVYKRQAPYSMDTVWCSSLFCLQDSYIVFPDYLLITP